MADVMLIHHFNF